MINEITVSDLHAAGNSLSPTLVIFWTAQGHNIYHNIYNLDSSSRSVIKNSNLVNIINKSFQMFN